MNTMAGVLLARETVEGEVVQALLDDQWDAYVAEHPEEMVELPALGN
jgi:cell division protease FtsH